MLHRANPPGLVHSAVITLLTLACTTFAIADTSTTTEAKIEAAYLRHLASYVRWPGGKQKDITLCILGQDPFGTFLDEMIEAKPLTRDGTPILIRRMRLEQDNGKCDIAFVSANSINRTFWQTLPQRRPVLLVSDHPEFTQRGGMVRFYPENNHIRIEIHLGNVKAAGLNISSELLKLATLTDAGSGEAQ